MGARCAMCFIFPLSRGRAHAPLGATSASSYWSMGWAVMVFELVFPLALFSQPALFIALGLAMLFHLANAYFFGLNRFVFAWLAAYPSLLWFQDKLIAV